MGTESMFDDDVTAEAEAATEVVESDNTDPDIEASAQEEGVEEAEEEIAEKAEGEDSEGEEEAPKKEVKEPSEPKKTIKAKVGDEEVDYDPEARIQVKVNGEYVEATLQDAINSYSGTSEIHRRINEANEVRREADDKLAEADKKLQTVVGGLKEFSQLVESGKYVDAVDKFASSNPNLDYNSFWTGLVQELLPQIQELAKATPEQRELLVQKNNQQYSERQIQQQKEALKREQEQIELQKYYTETTAKYGFSTKDVESVFAEVNEKLQKGELSEQEKAAWTSAAEDPKAQINLAIQELGRRQVRSYVEGVLKEVNPSISEEDLTEGTDILTTLAFSRSDVTEETLKQKAQKLYGNRKAASTGKDEAVQVLDEEPSEQTAASDDRVVRPTKQEEIDTYLFD